MASTQYNRDKHEGLWEPSKDGYNCTWATQQDSERDNQGHQALEKMDLQKLRESYTYSTIFLNNFVVITIKRDSTEQAF